MLICKGSYSFSDVFRVSVDVFAFLKFASQFELDHLKWLGSYPYHI